MKKKFNIRRDEDIKVLVSENRYFIPCTAESEGKNIEFIYDFENLKDFSQIKKARNSDKYRILIEASEFVKLTDEFEFSLIPENLYYDYAYKPKIKERKIKLNKQNFLKDYKSLIGYVLSDSLNYEDFYKGGFQLFKKEKALEKYCDLENLEDIKKQLMNDLKEVRKKEQHEYAAVSKKSVKRVKNLTYIMMPACGFLIAAAIILGFYIVPVNQKLIKAADCFINKEYSEVIEITKNIDLKRMDKTAKYQTAYSAVASESLKEEKKEFIISFLSSASDERILNFWTEIGRKNYDEAVEIGKQLSDSELTLYALLKKKYSVETDENIKGTEKENILNNLNTQIEKLNKELNGDKDKKEENLPSDNQDNSDNKDNTDNINNENKEKTDENKKDQENKAADADEQKDTSIENNSNQKENEKINNPLTLPQS